MVIIFLESYASRNLRRVGTYVINLICNAVHRFRLFLYIRRLNIIRLLRLYRLIHDAAEFLIAVQLYSTTIYLVLFIL